MDDYITRHGERIEEAFSKAVSAAINAEADDPVEFCAAHMLRAAEQPNDSNCVHQVRHKTSQLSSLVAGLQQSILAGRTTDACDALRAAYFEAYAAAHACAASLDEMREAGVPTSRAGYLRTLSELVLPAPAGRSWQDEWPDVVLKDLSLRTLSTVFHPTFDPPDVSQSNTVEWVAEHESIEANARKFQVTIGQISEATGISNDQAVAHTVLASRRNALAWALRNRNPCFAASIHALYGTVISVVQRQGIDAQAFYKNLRGPMGLALGDEAWERLEEPE